MSKNDPWDELGKKYPLLYREVLPSVGPGWYGLIDRLSEKLEKEISSKSVDEQNYLYASQIKEKFGTLRFYMHFTTPEIESHIEDAEDESSHICEVCGEAGQLRKGSWLLTLCDIHYKQRNCGL